MRINLKKKSHVKGFALRGAVLRKQVGEDWSGTSSGFGSQFSLDLITCVSVSVCVCVADVHAEVPAEGRAVWRSDGAGQRKVLWVQSSRRQLLQVWRDGPLVQGLPWAG